MRITRKKNIVFTRAVLKRNIDQLDIPAWLKPIFMMSGAFEGFFTCSQKALFGFGRPPRALPGRSPFPARAHFGAPRGVPDLPIKHPGDSKGHTEFAQSAYSKPS